MSESNEPMTWNHTAQDEFFMQEALREAEAALERGDRPIGAVIVHNGQVIARGANTFTTGKSDIAHAELNALLRCTAYLQEHGHECVIYTTCEPCIMCLGAIIMANIRAIVFGMPDNYIEGRQVIQAVPYIGKRVHRYQGGVLQNECIQLFRRFSEAEAALCLQGKAPS